ncbi:protease FtsH-inhibitory lysogeny factor CIII [Salmonella enterica]|nr:protease FtsH-inhibitory lysogeny factor CIII [Salmonella enterica]EHH1336778.1 protease FtsH-inhibitory lysogeny factor CIII [Salmonella enterica]
MQYHFAGWPIAGCPSESLLDRITRKLRTGWKRLVDILNKPGVPCNGINHLWLFSLNSQLLFILATK